MLYKQLTFAWNAYAYRNIILFSAFVPRILVKTSNFSPADANVVKIIKKSHFRSRVHPWQRIRCKVTHIAWVNRTPCSDLSKSPHTRTTSCWSFVLVPTIYAVTLTQRGLYHWVSLSWQSVQKILQKNKNQKVKKNKEKMQNVTWTA